MENGLDFLPLTSPDNLEIFWRLAAATLLAALLGTERTLAGKVAGMRTYALVSLGSALFAIISQLVAVNYAGYFNFDPLRVASQVVVGIGFLGAGLIILRQQKISGLTTAAGLWVAAGLGLATGYGLYFVAAIVTVITFFVFNVLWLVEKWVERWSAKPPPTPPTT